MVLFSGAAGRTARSACRHKVTNKNMTILQPSSQKCFLQQVVKTKVVYVGFKLLSAVIVSEEHVNKQQFSISLTESLLTASAAPIWLNITMVAG